MHNRVAKWDTPPVTISMTSSESMTRHTGLSVEMLSRVSLRFVVLPTLGHTSMSLPVGSSSKHSLTVLPCTFTLRPKPKIRRSIKYRPCDTLETRP